MDIRVIKKQVSVLSVVAAKRSGRRFGIGALVCAMLGASAFAQAQLDFIDPLGEELSRIEANSNAPAASPDVPSKPAKPTSATNSEKASGLLTRARDGASASASTVQDKASGFWGRMRASLGDVAESLGLPTAGLLGLLGLMLAGIACLVGWTLFRGRRKRRADIFDDNDVYQNGVTGRKRRMLGDSIPPAKGKVSRSDDDRFEETMPDDFETIFRDETKAVAAPIPPKTVDTATWRKPNLDKLRDSIKADWKSDKTEKAGIAAAATGIAGAGAAVAAAGATAFDYGSNDPGDQSLGDLSDGWEDWDTQVKPEDDPWGETLVTEDDDADSAALIRIRALRESLKAS